MMYSPKMLTRAPLALHAVLAHESGPRASSKLAAPYNQTRRAGRRWRPLPRPGCTPGPAIRVHLGWMRKCKQSFPFARKLTVVVLYVSGLRLALLSQSSHRLASMVRRELGHVTHDTEHLWGQLLGHRIAMTDSTVHREDAICAPPNGASTLGEDT